MTILDTILARKREEVAQRRAQTPEGELLRRAGDHGPPRGFIHRLKTLINEGQPAIIAEVKRASPSKGRIHPVTPFEPGVIAKDYAEHGAACISCLTDRDFFQGHEDYVARIRDAIALPVLRKDFLYDPYQVMEARAIGADAILLIMAMLSLTQALELEQAAQELNMDVLVEVHDEAELETAHHLHTPLLGINNRNLKTFSTTLDTSIRLAQRAAPDRLVVSESGIHGSADIQRLRGHGIHAFLIGGAFMRESHPGSALGRMLAELQP
jgi:indole-3-glycerol phosphate synthase